MNASEPAPAPVPPGSTAGDIPWDIPNDGNSKPLPTPWQWDDIWTYRRSRIGSAAPPHTSSPAHGGSVFVGDVSQQNWGGGNDLNNAYLFRPISSALSSAAAGRWDGGLNITALSMLEQRAFGWHHYYAQHTALSKNPALRDGSARVVLDGASAGTVHGLAKMPYLRDSRRSVGLDGFRLQYADLANADHENASYGVRFEDTVAIGSYGHDTHGLSSCHIPSYVSDAPKAKPYYLPLRALTNDGADNLLVAGKSMATSFSANSATRLHPEEWSSGTAAGAAAALVATSPTLNTTRQLLAVGMPALRTLLRSDALQQPMDWGGREQEPRIRTDDFGAVTMHDVFVNGDVSIDCTSNFANRSVPCEYGGFRIPGLVAVGNDTLIAFAEGRKYGNGGDDFGPGGAGMVRRHSIAGIWVAFFQEYQQYRWTGAT